MRNHHLRRSETILRGKDPEPSPDRRKEADMVGEEMLI
jgi:hypothetical protein